MTDVIKDATVRVTITDDTQQGAAKVKQSTDSLGKSVQTTMKKSTASAGMFGDQAGRALSQFNEKTEKGRQVLTAMGGAMGGAAGQAVYYGGTLSYIAGRFKPLELGIMAGVAAVTALAKAFYDDFFRASNRAIGKLKEMKSDVDGLTASIRSMTEAQYAAAMGWDKWDKSQRKYSTQRALLTAQIAELEHAVSVENSNMSKEAMVMRLVNGELWGQTEATKALAEAKRQLIMLDEEQRGAGKARAQETATALLEEQKNAIMGWVDSNFKRKAGSSGGKKIGKDGKADPNDITDQYWREQEIRERAWQQEQDRLGQIEKEKTAILKDYAEDRARQLEEIEEWNYERQESLAQKRIELEQKVADKTMGAIMALATEGPKGLARYLSQELQMLAFEQGAKALMETAESIAAYARYDAYAGSMHAAAAAQHAAFAAMAGGGAYLMSQAGKGGTSETSSTGGSDDLRGTGGDNQGGSTTIIINGGFFGRDAGREMTETIDRYQRSRHPGRPRTEVE